MNKFLIILSFIVCFLFWLYVTSLIEEGNKMLYQASLHSEKYNHEK